MLANFSRILWSPTISEFYIQQRWRIFNKPTFGAFYAFQVFAHLYSPTFAHFQLSNFWRISSSPAVEKMIWTSREQCERISRKWFLCSKTFKLYSCRYFTQNISLNIKLEKRSYWILITKTIEKSKYILSWVSNFKVE